MVPRDRKHANFVLTQKSVDLRFEITDLTVDGFENLDLLHDEMLNPLVVDAFAGTSIAVA